MYSSMDEYPLKNMGQVFVHGRIPSQKSWGECSYCGRILSQKDGAGIRAVDEYPVKNVGQVFVRGRIAPVRRMDFPCIRQIYSYSCGV